MKKLIRFSAVVLLIASLMSVLCSCGEVNIYIPPEDENTANGVGCGSFGTTCCVSFYSNQKYFDEDEITFTLSFAIDCASCINDYKNCIDHSALIGKKVGLFLVTDSGRYLLKESSDIFGNDDYLIEFSTSYPTIEDFKNSEEVTIPKEFFTQSDTYTSTLFFDIDKLDTESENEKEIFVRLNNARISPNFYAYKTDGETVHFSEEKYDINTPLWYDTENVYQVNNKGRESTYHIKNFSSRPVRLMTGGIQNFYINRMGYVTFLLKRGNKYEIAIYNPNYENFIDLMTFYSLEECLLTSSGCIYAVGKEVAVFHVNHDLLHNIAPVEDSESNRKITEEHLLKKERTAEGKIYTMENPDTWIGKILDKLGVCTQLVVTDENGERKVIYDALEMSIFGEKQPYNSYIITYADDEEIQN